MTKYVIKYKLLIDFISVFHFYFLLEVGKNTVRQKLGKLRKVSACLYRLRATDLDIGNSE